MFQRQNSVAVVAIVKGEEAFIDEWLAYHRLLGVNHFYLYDNDPELPLERLLEPHSDYVTVVEWVGEHNHLRGRNKQTKAYTDSLRLVRECWVAFIDGDEFITLRQHETLQEFLGGFPRVGAIQLTWHLFGSNGHLSDPKGLVTAALRRRHQTPGRMTKSINRTTAIRRIPGAHHCDLKWTWRRVDANCRRIFGVPHAGPTDVAHITHYLCRSYENWMSRIERGEAAFSQADPPTSSEHRWRFDRDLCHSKFLEVEAKTNEFVDCFMLRYEQPIRRFLAALGRPVPSPGSRD